LYQEEILFQKRGKEHYWKMVIYNGNKILKSDLKKQHLKTKNVYLAECFQFVWDLVLKKYRN